MDVFALADHPDMLQRLFASDSVMRTEALLHPCFPNRDHIRLAVLRCRHGPESPRWYILQIHGYITNDTES